MSLYNTNISSDETGITISLFESMNDAYNCNDIDTVRYLTGRVHYLRTRDQDLSSNFFKTKLPHNFPELY